MNLNQEIVLSVLQAPLVSEKTTLLSSHNNQYVFKVIKAATKHQIRAAIELLFSVDVQSVQVINVKGKRKIFGRRKGKRSDWKKAIIRLPEGQMINVGAG